MFLNNNVLLNISFLPNELVDIIWGYVDIKVKIFVNKTFYNKYHCLLEVPRYKYDNYIRCIIRNDCYFVFNKLFEENKTLWVKNKNITYKSSIFSCYLRYIKSIAIDYGSENCRNIITNYEKRQEKGFGKNRHKKNRNKNIKWTN